MALYITNHEGETFTWNIGIKLNPIQRSPYVAYIQADGDELEHIQNLFKVTTDHKGLKYEYTIPMTNQRVVSWYGDIARTILINL